MISAASFTSNSPRSEPPAMLRRIPRAPSMEASNSASCTASVNVPAVVKCTNIEDWGECTFEKNPKKPWRVDNDCKDTLDKLSLRLQQMPNGKLDVVGYTDESESVNVQTLGAQRSTQKNC